MWWDVPERRVGIPVNSGQNSDEKNCERNAKRGTHGKRDNCEKSNI